MTSATPRVRRRRAATRKEQQEVQETPSNAEATLRRYLGPIGRGLIKSEDDDQGLHDWLAAKETANEDARSLWERNLQKKLAKKLKAAA